MEQLQSPAYEQLPVVEADVAELDVPAVEEEVLEEVADRLEEEEVTEEDDVDEVGAEE